MKIHRLNLNSRVGLLTVVLLALGATARSADTLTLKDAFKDHFYVGAAINRTIATGTAARADNVNRTPALVIQPARFHSHRIVMRMKPTMLVLAGFGPRMAILEAQPI